MNRLSGKWPGEVASYDGETRICRVRIDGITDGSTDLPEAVFCNPLGDRAADTEIRILVNDPVWIEFEAGDPRFPIIVGYRTPRKGNPTGWRRWRHANIELRADGELKLISGAATVMQVGDSLQVSVGGQVTFTAPGYKFNGPVEFTDAVKMQAGAEINGSLINNTKNVGATHTHTSGAPGSPTSIPN